MRFIVAIISLLLALAPLQALAQDARTSQERIQAALRRAESAGVPMALLHRKVAEGRAKGIGEDVIAGAVEQRLGQLQNALQTMGSGVSAAELAVGADALVAGVTASALQGLVRSAPADRRAMAVAVLTQLVQQGEGSEHALERVQMALGRGAGALQNLPSQRPGGARGRNDAVARGEGAGPPASIPGPGTRMGDRDQKAEAAEMSGRGNPRQPKKRPRP